MSSKDWISTIWGEIATLEYGKSLKDYQNSKSDIPVYGTNGLIGFTTKSLCKFPSVIIGRKGAYRGVHFSNRPFYVIDTAFYLKPKIEKLDTRFAYYQLLTKDINSMDSGSAIPSTSREDFYNLELLLPPITTQKRIAQILSSLDEKIELNLQTIATLEAIAQAIFKEWFVDFNFPGATGEMVESELGLIPKGWKVGRLGDILEIKGGTTPSTKDQKYWGGNNFFATPKDLSNLKSPVLLSTERKITLDGVRQINSGILPVGTLLMSSRAPIGYLAITNLPVSINQGFIAINAKEYSNYYFLHWIKENIEILISRANGSTFLEISKSNFREITCILPPTDLFQKFNLIDQSILEILINNEKETQNLISIRELILPKLMNGEIEL
ncbi:MAG: restriction endonuclease subunit S [Chloroflexi bacterium HGW-Chloroflexi-3]|nr:MAG: restriction endonuclease subunit S [Chloroflexi bacterium HGW-Chloroflexi-3]